MKVTMKLADIEVTLDNPDEKDMRNINSHCLGCIEALMPLRVSLEGTIAARGERAEDSEGTIPTKELDVRGPDLFNSNMYR